VQASHHQRLAAVVQAGRGRLALGWYQAGEGEWQADGPAMVTTADELAEQIHNRSLFAVKCLPMNAKG